MNVKQFMEQITPRMERGEAFLAYWHLDGFMVLRTGPIEWLEHTVRAWYDCGKHDYDVYNGVTPEALERLQHDHKYNTVRVVKTKKKRKTVSLAAVKQFRRMVEQLRRDPRIGPVYTVEFDGVRLIKEGVDPNVLSAIRLPESGD